MSIGQLFEHMVFTRSMLARFSDGPRSLSVTPSSPLPPLSMGVRASDLGPSENQARSMQKYQQMTCTNEVSRAS